MGNYRQKIDKVEFEGYKLILTWVDDVISPHNDLQQPVHKYRLSVRNLDNPEEPKYFDFWGSIANFGEDNHPDAIEVFKYVLSDSLSYLDYSDIDDFASAFGYTSVSKVNEVYEGCQKSLSKLQSIGMTEGEIRDLHNQIEDF